MLQMPLVTNKYFVPYMFHHRHHSSMSSPKVRGLLEENPLHKCNVSSSPVCFMHHSLTCIPSQRVCTPDILEPIKCSSARTHIIHASTVVLHLSDMRPAYVLKYFTLKDRAHSPSNLSSRTLI